MNDEADGLKARLGALASKVEALEKRYERLIGRAAEYVPRQTAIAREGLSLEIYVRLALIAHDYNVAGPYSYLYHSEAQVAPTERSVDVYAFRDSVYTVPEGKGRRSGESWAERTHLLVEAKQRRPGVEWIFARKPTSRPANDFTGQGLPVANSGIELRPSETGLNSSPNPKDVNNAIAQLEQAQLPFLIALEDGSSYPGHAGFGTFASSNKRDHSYLVLVTNAKLRMFSPPPGFIDLDRGAVSEEDVFPEVPWLVFEPELPPGLLYHQRKTLEMAEGELAAQRTGREAGIDLEVLKLHSEASHQVHIINFDHVGKLLHHFRDPPRLEQITINLSVDGGPASSFTIDGDGLVRD